MALDLHVLDNEIRQGRLSLDNFKNGVLLMEKFDEGFLAFNPEGGREKMPEGYCLHYGQNKGKKTAYFVNAVDLLKAEYSLSWASVCIHTKARWNNGIEIMRADDRDKGFKPKAKFSPREWDTIKYYAVAPERSRSTKCLEAELERYTHEAIMDLALHFGMGFMKPPRVILAKKKAGRYYHSGENKIVIDNQGLSPQCIYHEAGHYLHEQRGADYENKSHLTASFFRKIIEETVAFYCGRIGNKNYGLSETELDIFRALSLDEKIIKNIAEDMDISKKIMGANPGDKALISLSQGKLGDGLMKRLGKHIRDKKNSNNLAHYIGAIWGNMLFDNGYKDIVKTLMASKETDYPLLFFKTKDFMRRMDCLYDNICKMVKKHNPAGAAR